MVALVCEGENVYARVLSNTQLIDHLSPPGTFVYYIVVCALPACLLLRQRSILPIGFVTRASLTPAVVIAGCLLFRPPQSENATVDEQRERLALSIFFFFLL